MIQVGKRVGSHDTSGKKGGNIAKGENKLVYFDEDVAQSRSSVSR